MKLPRNYQTLLAGVSLLALGCATPAKPRDRIARCLTDPNGFALHCDGLTIPFSKAYDYVCHKLADDLEYMDGCK